MFIFRALMPMSFSQIYVWCVLNLSFFGFHNLTSLDLWWALHRSCIALIFPNVASLEYQPDFLQFDVYEEPFISLALLFFHDLASLEQLCHHNHEFVSALCLWTLFLHCSVSHNLASIQSTWSPILSMFFTIESCKWKLAEM